MVYAYIDEVLVIINTGFKDHIKALDQALLILTGEGLKENQLKSFFG